jgi:CDP-diacylglycerol---serine O-phosphatidyltransferase
MLPTITNILHLPHYTTYYHQDNAKTLAKDMKQHIPNCITLANLVFGCCAILTILGGQYSMAVYCLVGSFLCDYADGMIARALKVSSPLGKELDSLADVVSFGVVPGMFLYAVLTRHFCLGHNCVDGSLSLVAFAKLVPPFILSACAALRLAKFNLDTRQTTYFLGLTTPATTVFVVGICMAILQAEPIGVYLDKPVILYSLIAVLCIMMLSEIKLLGLKINLISWAENTTTIVGLLVAGMLIYFLSYTGATCAILVYIFASGAVLWRS